MPQHPPITEQPPQNHPFEIPLALLGSRGLDLIILIVLIVGWRTLQPRLTQIRTKLFKQPPTATRRLQNPIPPTQLPFTQPIQWLGYAQELRSQQQYQAALAVYDHALTQFPQDYRFWHERGLTFAIQQNFEAALENYDHAFALNPQSRALAHERGDTLLELEQYEAALSAFDIYLKFDPTSSHVLADRGVALYHLGRYPEAADLLDQVVRLNKRDPSSLKYAAHYLVKSLQALGQPEKAQAISQNILNRK